VRKTANEKRSQALSAFFLSWLLLKIVVRSRSITAKAQGLILSASAAGAIIAKKLSLFESEVSGCSVGVQEVISVSVQGSIVSVQETTIPC
jgi:hypothetical protein